MRRLLFAALGAASLAWSCRGSDVVATRSVSQPARVTVASVRRGEIIRSLRVPGTVRPYQQVSLYTKVAGYLKSIRVDRGDRVKAAEVVAEIEAPEMLADLVPLQAELEVAKADFARVMEARKKASDLVTPRAVDEARGRFEVAKAGVDRLRILLDYAKIVAPFDGVVTERMVDPGAFIPAATSGSTAKSSAVLSIMDFSRVRVELFVPQSEVLLIKAGLGVKVSVAELPNRAFAGTVSRFAYALDSSTKNMAVEVEIPNADFLLRPGMYASCELILENRDDVQLIPAEALVSEKNKAWVFVARDGKAARVPIRTGFDDGVSVEVLEGIASGDQVILAGKQAIQDGQPVDIGEGA